MNSLLYSCVDATANDVDGTASPDLNIPVRVIFRCSIVIKEEFIVD